MFVLFFLRNRKGLIFYLKVKLVEDDKKFWENVVPFFQIKSKERTKLPENENIISNYKSLKLFTSSLVML